MLLASSIAAIALTLSANVSAQPLGWIFFDVCARHALSIETRSAHACNKDHYVAGQACLIDGEGPGGQKRRYFAGYCRDVEDVLTIFNESITLPPELASLALRKCRVANTFCTSGAQLTCLELSEDDPNRVATAIATQWHVSCCNNTVKETCAGKPAGFQFSASCDAGDPVFADSGRSFIQKRLDERTRDEGVLPLGD